MEFKWCFLLFILIEAKNVPLQVKNTLFLRCLLEDTFEPCTVFPERSFYNVSSISPKLINEYGNLSIGFHEVVKQQNFTLISEEILDKIPDAILLLLPVNHLSKINSKFLLKLILQRADTKAVKHLVKAYLLGNKAENLYEQTAELSSRSLTWIADVLSSEIYGAPYIISNTPLLFFSPPFAVLFNNTSEKLFYLSLWEEPNSIFKKINKSYLRIWAYAMNQNNFLGPLNSWNDLYLERWGVLLTASTADELVLLNRSNLSDLHLLFSFGFSSIQLRTLFDGFMERIMTYRWNYFVLSNSLVKLLPVQLLKFSEKVLYLEQLRVLPSYKSLPISKQIFLLLMFKNSRNEENPYHYINNFSYVLSLKNLSQYVKKPLPSSVLMRIQSSHFSKSQLYILSTNSTLFNFNSESIFQCKDFITVLPSRDIIFNQTASQVQLHLLANVVAENIPQSFSVLNKLWSVLGSPSTFKKVLANKGSDILLEYLPSRYIIQFTGSILSTIGEDINIHKKLPDSFISTLLNSYKTTVENFSFLNINESQSFLFSGISCNDISSLDPYDFVIFMLKFNEQRKASGKDFPKNLQHCFVEKFFSYIQLKSTLFQRMLEDSKLSLLNEAEIDSIGGYIFSALPVDPIVNSKYTINIIKCIGQLSLSELILAAPISRLQELGSVFFHEKFEVGRKFDDTIFDLGNLTLFLDEHHISQINETFFKLILESKFMDHRLCAVKSSRIAWFNLLKRSFGETSCWTYQTLVTLGDLLIVVPAKELDQIPSKSWIYAADVLTSHYNDIIKYSSSLKFYEVCMMQLSSSEEAQLYLSELKNLVEAFVDAAQLQLNTVTPAKFFEKNNTNSGVFTFLDSGKSNIKISIPSIRNIINTESPINRKTSFEITQNENKYVSQFSAKSDLNFSLNYEISSLSRLPLGFNNDSGYSAVSVENIDVGDQYLFNTSEESMTDISFSGSNTDIKDTTVPYLDFNPVTHFLKTSYSTSEGNNILEKYNEPVQGIYISTSGGQPIIMENNILYETTSYDKILNLSFVKETSSFLNRISEKHFYSATPLEGSLNSVPFKDMNLYTSKSTDKILNIDGIKMKNLKSYYKALNTTLYNISTGIFTSQESSYSTTKSSTSGYIIDKINTKPSTHLLYNYETVSWKSSTPGFGDQFTAKAYTVPISDEKTLQDTQETDFARTVDPKIYKMDYVPTPSLAHGQPSGEKQDITDINEIYSNINSRRKAEIEHLLKNNSAKTEFLNLSFSSINSKLKKFSPIVIGNDTNKRVKRSFRKWTCEAFKMIGKSVEVIITENLIESMSEEDLNECVDLFSEMDLSSEVFNLIWRKVKLEHVFLSGKLISAINISEVESKDLSVTNPWALETIHLLGKYSNDPKIKQHIIKEIAKNTNLQFSVEILVTLSSLICQLPQTSFQLIEPNEFLKASAILGRSLPCNHSCLFQLSNIAVKKGGFEDPLEWNPEDVSNLGIIIAGLDFCNWKKLIFSKKSPLIGLSENALRCLTLQHLKELEEHSNINLQRIHLKDENLFNMSINFDFFEPAFHSDQDLIEDISYSIQLIDFYLGFHVQIFFISIIMSSYI